MHKRIELANLKELQEELIQYNFFERFTGFGNWGTNENDDQTGHADFNPSNTSAAYFEKIPNLNKLVEFLNTIINIELISHVYVINFESKFNSDIHRDEDCIWALNIPILNCEDSVTIFYDDSLNELDRITLDVPHFLNVGKYFHQVISYSDQNRLTMSIRFTNDTLDGIIK